MGAWSFVDRPSSASSAGSTSKAKRARYVGRAEAAAGDRPLQAPRRGTGAARRRAHWRRKSIDGDRNQSPEPRRIGDRGDGRAWLKQPGDTVAVDDPLVELETDKATLEVNAPAAGTLTEILAEEGANVRSARSWAGSATARRQPTPARRDARCPAAPAPGQAAPSRQPARARGPGAGSGARALRSRRAQAGRREPGSTREDSRRPARTAASPRPMCSPHAATPAARRPPPTAARAPPAIGREKSACA